MIISLWCYALQTTKTAKRPKYRKKGSLEQDCDQGMMEMESVN